MLLLTVLIQVIGTLFREMFNVDHVLIEDGYVSRTYMLSDLGV